MSYGADDADLFFGRSQERDRVIANLRAARLTVLYGPSGVGKSSLLHAGVVHRLRAQGSRDENDDEDDISPRTTVVILDEWARDPALVLAEKIRALTPDGTAPDDGGAADSATAADGGMAASLRAAIDAHRARRRGSLLLILDQFEEYIRLHPDPLEQSFDDVISELVRDPRVPARILIAIREDRLADLDRFGGRIPQLLGNMLRLGPLTRDAAREAIEGPIERYCAWAHDGGGGREVTLEPQLADTVLDELVVLSAGRSAKPSAGSEHNGGGGLPHVEATFLQLVMRHLWDADVESDGSAQLRVATLARLGGAEQIVAAHVGDALAGLSAGEQDVAAEMLRFLVTPSGATACLTARDLADYTSRPVNQIESLAERLSRPPARLLRGVAASDGAGAAGYELPQVLAEPALRWGARRRSRKLEARVRRLQLTLVAVTAAALTLVAYGLAFEPLQRLDRAAVDARFELRGIRPADPLIKLVAIGDADLGLVTSSQQPPRAVVARGLTAIAAARPRAVVSDIIFTGSQADQLSERDPRRRRASAADAALIRAIDAPRLKRRLVLATDRLDSGGRSQLFGREDQTLTDSTRPAVGYAGFPADPGDVARKVERGVQIAAQKSGSGLPLSTLAIATASVAGHVEPASQPKGPTWIDYRGPDETFERVPFGRVLRGDRAALERLRDKIVVLGITAKAFGDVHGTSAPGGNRMDGPEIQANAISTALDRFPLRDGGAALDVALIVLLGLLPLGLALRLRPALVAAGCVGAAALFCAAAQLAFGGGRVISIAYPLASLALATIGVLAVALLRGRQASSA